MDAAGYAPCASPISYSNLSAAYHVFYVRGIDALGNISPDKTRAFTVDLADHKPDALISTGKTFVGNGIDDISGSRHLVKTCDLNRHRWAGFFHFHAAVIGHDTDTADRCSCNNNISGMKRSILNEQCRDRATAFVKAGFDNRSFGGTVRVSLEGDSRIYTGNIVRLSPVIAEQTKMLLVEAEVVNPGTLRPGSFARVSIITDESGRSPALPDRCIITFAGGGGIAASTR